MNISVYRPDRRDGIRPTHDDMTRLQRAYLLTVPFENLDISAGWPISLDQEALLDKIVRRRRGG